MAVHKWLVLAASTTVTLLVFGFILAFGNLFTDMMETFEATRSEVGAVQSVMLAFTLATGLPNGILTEKLGAMKVGILGAILVSFGTSVAYFAKSVTVVLLTIGIIASDGVCCLTMAAITATGYHFTGKSALMAFSFVQTGSGIGGIIYPYFLRYLAKEYGFSGTVLIVGGMLLNTLPLALLLRPPLNNLKLSRHVDTPSSEKEVAVSNKGNFENQLKDNETSQDDQLLENESFVDPVKDSPSMDRHKFSTALCSVIRNSSFIVTFVGIALSYQAVLLLVIYIQDIFTDAGYTQKDAALALLCFNLSGIIGRQVPGLAYQFKSVPTLCVPIFANIGTGVSLLGSYFLPSLGTKIALVCLAGVSMGILITLFPIIPLKYFDKTALPGALGLETTLAGVLIVTGGSLSGRLRDASGSYLAPILFGVSGTVVAFGLLVIGHCLRQKSKNMRTADAM